MSVSLHDRGKALEQSFFREVDKQLLEKLRADQEQKKSLAAACTITDEAVLDQLIEAGIEGETMVAFALYPLVAVAWADGNIQAKEREAILSALAEDGLVADDPNYRLVEQWLAEQPGDELLATWKEYVAALQETLGESGVAPLKRDILGRAQRVAESAGGILGLGNKVSESEAAVLSELEKAFA